MAEQVGMTNEPTGPNIEECVKHSLSLACDKEPSQIKMSDRISVDLRCTTDYLLRAAADLERSVGVRFTIGDFKRSRTVRDLVNLVQRYYDANK